MEKNRLIGRRKANGFSQSMVAEKLCMDVSNYNRREKGQVKISLREWEKLADILQVPIEEIYESDDTQVFICRDSSTVHYQGTNNIYSVPEYLLDTQRKYIEILENEIRELRTEPENRKS
ncbi:MAG: helix-turn-helix transcriptional regulator [Dysgonamonadaceae bacterium]|jgi:transcriptional regulator with XRE-family HTH domain|nr:helix-turn-helix transcriptional regulator [Dysgonamonadaceae bacterium]